MSLPAVDATTGASNNAPGCSPAHRARVSSHVKNSDDLRLKKGLFAFRGFGLISADEREMQRKRQREKDAAEAKEMKERLSVQQERQERLQRTRGAPASVSGKEESIG